jgi:hypothetical protein
MSYGGVLFSFSPASWFRRLPLYLRKTRRQRDLANGTTFKETTFRLNRDCWFIAQSFAAIDMAHVPQQNKGGMRA